jgi:hypothetical protein
MNSSKPASSSRGESIVKTKGLFLISLACVTALVQGTVKFANFDAATGLDAPVFSTDGVTPLSGAFAASLLSGPTESNLSFVAMTNFLSGGQAGYFDGGTQSITNVQGGSNAIVLIEVWNFAAATPHLLQPRAQPWLIPGVGFSLLSPSSQGTRKVRRQPLQPPRLHWPHFSLLAWTYGQLFTRATIKLMVLLLCHSPELFNPATT